MAKIQNTEYILLHVYVYTSHTLFYVQSSMVFITSDMGLKKNKKHIINFVCAV